MGKLIIILRKFNAQLIRIILFSYYDFSYNNKYKQKKNISGFRVELMKKKKPVMKYKILPQKIQKFLSRNILCQQYSLFLILMVSIKLLVEVGINIEVSESISQSLNLIIVYCFSQSKDCLDI